MGEVILGRRVGSEGSGSEPPKQAAEIRSKPKHRNQIWEQAQRLPMGEIKFYEYVGRSLK